MTVKKLLLLRSIQIPWIYSIVTAAFVVVLCCATSSLADDSVSKIVEDQGLKSKAKDSPQSANKSSNGSFNGGSDNNHGDKEVEEGESEGLVVAIWNYDQVRDPLIFTVILVITGICKIVYHHSGFLSSKIPESCILIILGVLFGALFHFTGAENTLPTFFKPHEFFIFLLPPIILEAAYSLHDRTFIENLGSILLFAVVGTILACVFVGLSLFGLTRVGAMGSIDELGFVEVMVFASLIVAVDPVAVLAVFNEIGVNQVLYFLVFGESLLNDGVTVVLYKVFQAYNVMDDISEVHIVLGVVKFIVVCLGGLALGVLAGIVSALLTKYATHVKVAQPLIMYTVAYLGFLCSELFEFSGIISLVGCGITQKHYAFNNISDKSKTTINYFTKVIGTACETIIFMFLGLSMVNDHHVWHTGFALWTILLCNVYRFMITFGLTFLINTLDAYRVRKISWDEQFMIAYGGLRGAVCFSLVALLNPDEFPAKKMFVTTTLAVIIFTVFIQGITIKPLVYLFQIKLAPEKEMSMYKELQEHVTDHLMAGIEDIIGDHGKNHLREKMQYLDARYIQPLLLVDPDPTDTQLKVFYDHLILKEHYNHMKLSNVKHMQEMPELPPLSSDVFLHGLLSTTVADDSGSRDRRISTIKVADPRIPAGVVTLGDEDVAVRNRRSKSLSYDTHRSRMSFARRPSTPSSPDVKNAVDLRNLLRQRRTSNSRLTRHDPDLAYRQDFQSQFRKKTDQNQRLRRLSTMGEYNPKLAAQLSWCAADSDETVQRRNLSGKENSSLRNSVTLDLPNHGRRATLDPLCRLSPHLYSLHEEIEDREDKRRSTLGDIGVKEMESEAVDGEKNNKENEEEKEEEEGEEKDGGRGIKKREDRGSSKHKLERQKEMEIGDPEEVTGQGQGVVPLKNLSSNGHAVVRVDIENGDCSYDLGDGETTRL